MLVCCVVPRPGKHAFFRRRALQLAHAWHTPCSSCPRVAAVYARWPACARVRSRHPRWQLLCPFPAGTTLVKLVLLVMTPIVGYTVGSWSNMSPFLSPLYEVPGPSGSAGRLHGPSPRRKLHRTWPAHLVRSVEPVCRKTKRTHPVLSCGCIHLPCPSCSTLNHCPLSGAPRQTDGMFLGSAILCFLLAGFDSLGTTAEEVRSLARRPALPCPLALPRPCARAPTRPAERVSLGAPLFPAPWC